MVRISSSLQKCRDYVVTNEKQYDNYDWSVGKY
jgi:hypothetical protein